MADSKCARMSPTDVWWNICSALRVRAGQSEQTGAARRHGFRWSPWGRARLAARSKAAGRDTATGRTRRRPAAVWATAPAGLRTLGPGTMTCGGGEQAGPVCRGTATVGTLIEQRAVSRSTTFGNERSTSRHADNGRGCPPNRYLCRRYLESQMARDRTDDQSRAHRSDGLGRVTVCPQRPSRCLTCVRRDDNRSAVRVAHVTDCVISAGLGNVAGREDR